MMRSQSSFAVPRAGELGESCPHCLQTYHYELEVRCVDCDGPSCPFCVVVERLETTVRRCPECARGDR